MKKKIFHIAVSVALFCALTVIYFVVSNNKETVFSVPEGSDESKISFTSGENFECIGKPIEILMLPKEVRAGDTVSVAFKGESNTEYGIKVYRPSGLCESEDLVTRKSDGKGRVGWDFTLPEAAEVGKLRIAVTSEDTYFIAEAEIVG